MSELPQRRKGERDRTYRRPPAEETAGTQPDGVPASSWFADAGSAAPAAPETAAPAPPGSGAGSTTGPVSGPAGPPEFGPASPGGPGRTSFGFSAGPISGNRPLGEQDDSPGASTSGGPSSGAFPVGGSSGGFPVGSSSPGGRDDSGGWPAAGADPGGLPIVRTNPVDAAPHPPAARQRSGMDAGLSLRERATWADTLDVPRDMPPGAAAPAVRAAPLVRPRRSRTVTVGMAVLGTIAVLVIALTGVVFYSGPDSRINEMLNLGGRTATAAARLVTAPLNGRTKAAFEMLAASDRLRVSVTDIGDDLFRISTPDDSPVLPSPQLTDDGVRLQVSREGGGTDAQVDVVLSARVRWTLRFSGYATERAVDLGDGQVVGIEIVGGTRRAVLSLSKATTTVPVKITGGVDELTVRAPAGSPVRVKVGGGATTVTAGTRTLRNVAAGSTLTPKDWNTSGRYDVEAASKITLLSVEAG
ncbi:hypothetical protein [Actinoplanes siamensis]|uniref:Uncharacterized protein n=1 Tax=Actinoplanes siamensis TaxID=1223317 RepID=A0A919NCW7_9ACTN|nr:hypothetical protein [Actinoplanes siamensis]GIF08613.1 hypothetical protein Asi03nite_61510 [Actinoplanes siamensis]